MYTCSGSDGLVKVWTIKTNECVATLDQHTEKVRPLLTGRFTESMMHWSRTAVLFLA